MSVNLIGDIVFTGLLNTNSEVNNKRFSEVVPFLSKNLVFANLEVPVKVDDVQSEYKKSIHYSLIEPTRELLKLLNIGCVSLANNHIYDCKMNGLKATIDLLDELGIYHTGAGWKQEHIEPLIINDDGLKIGFIAYVDKSTNPKTEFFPELRINYFEPEKVKKDIQSIRQKVDKIICSIHWGVDYSYYPTPSQVKIAKELVNSGVDVIMGHHPHTFQPFENYKGASIFYSLGGMTFGDLLINNELVSLYRKTKTSAITDIDFKKSEVSFFPIKELQGNYIEKTSRDYFKWSHKMWIHYKIKNSSAIFRKIYAFKENILDRIYEYFFGYYKNPFKRLFQIKNYRKLLKLIKHKK